MLAILLHVGVGSTLWLSPWQVVKEFLHGQDSSDAVNTVVWQIRLPRALGCALVGSILGLVGSAFQAFFRNPLAEPFIIGVSSGAAVGTALVAISGLAATMGGLFGFSCSFATGIASLGLVLALSKVRGAVNVQTLLLSGVIVGSMLSSLLTLVLLWAGQDTNRILRQLMGDTSSFLWSKLIIMFACLIIFGTVLYMHSRQLNVFSVGEETAGRLGIDLDVLKRRVLIAGTVMVAAAVGASGIIGFLGLVAPHLSRRLFGVDLRYAMIGATLIGSLLLLVADLVAQRAIPGVELPPGAVTAVLGSPALLYLLRKR